MIPRPRLKWFKEVDVTGAEGVLSHLAPLTRIEKNWRKNKKESRDGGVGERTDKKRKEEKKREK